MKNAILLLLLSFGAILSMEQPRSPQRGQKRRPLEEFAEPVAKAPAVEAKTAFELLPDEIKTHMLTFLTTAHGATKRARLDNAAENIRAFLRPSSSFKHLGDDQRITEYLITELANRYADGDKLAAAIALGTEAAGNWLNSILTTQDPKLLPERTKIIQKLGEHFIDAAKDGRIQVIKFLLKFASKYNFPWYHALKGAVKNNRLEMVRLIFSLPTLQHGANNISYQVNLADEEGATMLFDAVRNSNEPLIDLLLAARANVNKADVYNLSPIHLAAEQNNPSIVRKILAAGIRPNILNSVEAGTGQTPLMIATEKGNLEIITSLLDAGANVNQKNNDDETTLSLAELSNLKNKDEIIKLLKERGAQ